MSGLSGFAKVVALAATMAIGAIVGAQSASAQFGKRHEGGGGVPAAERAPARGGGVFRGGGGAPAGGAAIAPRGGGNPFGGGRSFNGGGVARSFNGGAQPFAGGGQTFRGGGVTINRFAGAPAFRGGSVSRQPTVRFRSGDGNRGVRQPRAQYGYGGYVAPYPVYSPTFYGGYRTCVIRKRWVHTRFGWRKLPRRVCFRRY